MAKFRNIFKRRSRMTGMKKTSQSAQKRLGPFEEALEEYYSAHPMTAAQPQVAREEKVRVTTGMVPDDGDVQPMGGVPIAGELWVKYFTYVFSRLRQWFRSLWASARFTHPAAWLLAGRKQSRP